MVREAPHGSMLRPSLIAWPSRRYMADLARPSESAHVPPNGLSVPPTSVLGTTTQLPTYAGSAKKTHRPLLPSSQTAPRSPPSLPPGKMGPRSLRSQAARIPSLCAASDHALVSLLP